MVVFYLIFKQIPSIILCIIRGHGFFPYIFHIPLKYVWIPPSVDFLSVPDAAPDTLPPENVDLQTGRKLQIKRGLII